jgi:hypothetical protein
MANYKNTVIDLQNIQEDITPATDDVRSLGDASNKWTGVHVGPDSLYMEDNTTGADVAITVDDGVFFIDGIAQAQLPNLAVTNLTFSDDTVQTTAYVASGEVSYAISGGTDGTQPTFTGDPLFTGSYIRNGSNQVYFQIQADMDNITGFGTGQYYMTLPFPSKYEIVFRDGCVHDGPAGGGTYHLSGQVAAGSDIMTLWSTDRVGNAIEDVPFTATSAFTLSTADNFHIAGSYIAD